MQHEMDNAIFAMPRERGAPWFQEFRGAWRYAFATAPAVISYLPQQGGKESGWVVYPPTEAGMPGGQPEMVVLQAGMLPMPLSETGLEVMMSFIRWEATKLIENAKPR